MSTSPRPPQEAPAEPDQLEGLNRALADLLPDGGPASLVASGAACRADSLVLCGILGGKDVGKSTLINALVQAPVSVDSDEVGRGTTCPVAYVHQDEQEALRRRLTARTEGQGELKVLTHSTDSARNLVLLDLPDFDSTFTRHLEMVRDAVGRMDRVIWICDPKKIGDRLWGELLPQVVKDPANVYCVLNKFDLLLGDEPAEDGWPGALAKARDFLSDCLATLQVGNDPQQRFVLSAAYTNVACFSSAVAGHWGDERWSRFSEARPAVEKLADDCLGELGRLRDLINAPVAPDRARGIKLANQRAEARANVRALREHYELDHHLAALEATLAALAGEMDSRFDRQVTGLLAGRLVRQGRNDAELADELMKHRVEHWPILRTMFWTCRGVVRWLGRRIAPPVSVPQGPSDPLRVGGISIEDRLGGLQVSLRTRFAGLLSEMRLDDDWPSPAEQARHVRGQLENMVEQIDEQIISACRAEYGRPGALAKLLVWLPLLWFPLVQPLTEGLLESAAAQGTLGTLHGLSLVVRALGAASLLRGLVVVLLLYVFGLAVMYARSMRAVREAQRGALAEPPATDEPVGAYLEGLGQILADEVFAPLAEPLEAAHARLSEINAELETIAPGPHTAPPPAAGTD